MSLDEPSVSLHDSLLKLPDTMCAPLAPQQNWDVDPHRGLQEQGSGADFFGMLQNKGKLAMHRCHMEQTEKQTAAGQDSGCSGLNDTQATAVRVYRQLIPLVQHLS